MPQTLPRVAQYMQAQPYQTEILVVDDGSRDGTAQIAQEIAWQHPIVRLIRAEHGGKGHAIRTGMLQAKGEYAFLADADWAMPITELPKFLPPQQGDFHVAIGSREGQGAVRYNEKVYRHLMGRVFNWLVQTIAVRGFEDTQCGFKCFHQSVVQDLFGHQTIDGFGFDVELLYLAQKRGYTIIEVPIHWYHQMDSKVDPVKDTLRMVRDMVKVRLNDYRGRYTPSTLPSATANLSEDVQGP